MNSIWFHSGDTLKWFWIYWLMPFAGSLLAIVFYRFVYMKTQLMIVKDQQEENCGAWPSRGCDARRSW